MKFTGVSAKGPTFQDQGIPAKRTKVYNTQWAVLLIQTGSERSVSAIPPLRAPRASDGRLSMRLRPDPSGLHAFHPKSVSAPFHRPAQRPARS